MTAGLSKLFQVGYADFCAIWKIDDPQDWEPPFVVREAGVFIPAPSRHLLKQLTPAEIGRVSHPTGNPEEAVLSFPCSLEEMMSWERDRIGEFSNAALVGWMQGRVRMDRPSMSDADLLLLFQVERADAIRLLPHVAPSHPLPTFPCSLDALLQWCDDDAEERPWVAPPSNAGIVQLIKERLAQLAPVEGSASKKLGARERNNLRRVVLGLGKEDPKKMAQPDWEAVSREEFYLEIAKACKAGNFSLNKGSIAGIEEQLKKALEAGWFEAPMPLEKTLRKIIGEVRSFCERPKR